MGIPMLKVIRKAENTALSQKLIAVEISYFNASQAV
jgi:hypothetical protein